MPRYYAKHKLSIDFSVVLEASKQIKIHGNSIRSVAKSMNIPRATLTRHVKKINEANIDVSTATDDSLIDFFKTNSTPGANPVFNAQQEKALMQYVLKASNIHYGLSIAELKTLVYQYAKKIGISYPASWNDNSRASNDWYYAFMNRHPNLSLRTPEQVSQNRARSFNKEAVDAFFNNLRSVLIETPFEPHRIWNMDECSLSTVPTKAVKVIAQKGRKRIGSSTSAERGTNVSMALSVSASGQSIPPFFLFPRKKMKDVYMTHATHGAIGIANGSGWMTSAEFTKYMDFFIKHTGANAGSPTLLLLDNHTSHLSIEAIDKAVEHGITMLSFPPHCTHRMQPLDVAVFGPLKTFYTQQHDDWKRSNVGVVFDLHHIPLITEKCLDIAATPKNIKSGFKSTGIYPFDATVFTEVDFVAARLSRENQRSDSDDSDTEKQRRTVVPGADIETAAHAEMITHEAASTSGTISSAFLRETLREVGPLKRGTPAKKSNRGRKPMKTAILTSPEVVFELKEKADAKRKKLEKRSRGEDGKAPVPKKRKYRAQSTTKRNASSSEDEDVDFCILCMEDMPKKLNRNNSIHCDLCDRAVHLKCVSTGAYFTCPNCESE